MKTVIGIKTWENKNHLGSWEKDPSWGKKTIKGKHRPLLEGRNECKKPNWLSAETAAEMRGTTSKPEKDDVATISTSRHEALKPRIRKQHSTRTKKAQKWKLGTKKG